MLAVLAVVRKFGEIHRRVDWALGRNRGVARLRGWLVADCRLFWGISVFGSLSLCCLRTFMDVRPSFKGIPFFTQGAKTCVYSECQGEDGRDRQQRELAVAENTSNNFESGL
jgi:hypothetical protein